MASIAPSERLRRELDQIVAGVGDEHDPVAGARGRGDRLPRPRALRTPRRADLASHRLRVTVKTTAGPLELERPRLRNASGLAFASQFVGKGNGADARAGSARARVVPRGLSVRDVEAALAETFDEPMVSKPTVSRICEQARERYRAWCDRRLDGITMTPRAVAEIERPRRGQASEPARSSTTEEVIAA